MHVFRPYAEIELMRIVEVHFDLEKGLCDQQNEHFEEKHQAVAQD
jgi:hypothetical protein